LLRLFLHHFGGIGRRLGLLDDRKFIVEETDLILLDLEKFLAEIVNLAAVLFILLVSSVRRLCQLVSE